MAGQPPLSCRTSPPIGGRSDVARLSPIVDVERRARRCQSPPLRGMSGRTEGGVKERGALPTRPSISLP
ncbi:MAG: hypothetical protein EOR71_06250 [Mesorhizobium sp.]|nr:MAG: hypothetical protein EOR71_06250 [Mesorhizobium sp.]